jgi:hypothetical protein
VLWFVETPNQNRSDRDQSRTNDEVQADDPRVQIGQNADAADYRLGDYAKTEAERRPDHSLALGFSASHNRDKRKQCNLNQEEGQKTVGELDEAVNSLLGHLG